MGPNVEANRAFVKKLLQKLTGIAGAVDLHIQQPYDYPQINVDVDRTKAEFLGLTQQNVASNMLISLSGSFQTSPSFWIDPIKLPEVFSWSSPTVASATSDT